MSRVGFLFHLTQLGAMYCANIYAFNLFDLYHTEDYRGEKQFYAFYDVLSLHLGMEVDVLALILRLRGRSFWFYRCNSLAVSSELYFLLPGTREDPYLDALNHRIKCQIPRINLLHIISALYIRVHFYSAGIKNSS